MHINIQPNAATSISKQIRAQLTAAIAARELRAGERLTPPAELAAQLPVSPAAVLKAYRGLECDGLCRERGRGFEVAPATPAEQRERARRQRIEGDRQSLLDELELARQVQRRLMPRATLETNRYAIAARVHAAGFVSGDFYDVLERDGAVDVVVADVSGKGVGASLIMAFVKARLSALPPDLPVAEVLRRLNRQLYADLGPRHFVAMAYARAGARLEIANAGLPYPLLLRPERPAEYVAGPNPSLPLGVREEVAYRSLELSLSPGDRLLLYSDGIPEVPTSGGEPLGYTKLASLVESYARPGPPALEWLDRFMARIAGSTECACPDDQTALVVERRA